MYHAPVAELVDALDSKSSTFGVGVRFPPGVHFRKGLHFCKPFAFLEMNSMFYVYILYSTTSRKFYVGQTNNLTNRLERHNSGYVKSTKSGRPWELLHHESYESRSLAMKREIEIKSWKSAIKIKEMINASR